jgi:hypothetical protein
LVDVSPRWGDFGASAAFLFGSMMGAEICALAAALASVGEPEVAAVRIEFAGRASASVPGLRFGLSLETTDLKDEEDLGPVSGSFAVVICNVIITVHRCKYLFTYYLFEIE